jgi:hypothetical protein
MNQPSRTLNRRPGIELSLSAPAASGGSVGGVSEDPALEHSLFDVPAFLRRQN